jgi:pectate lyase-like protein
MPWRALLLIPLLSMALAGLTRSGRADEDDAKLRDEAVSVMRKAVEYYRTKVAYRGGYVYYYSPDLKLRYGEGMATPTQIWVQPPGTPTVGLAYLAAYRATGEKFYLDAARAAGEALIYGQLQSGGWQNCVDFDPQRRVNLYRNGKGGGANNSTLDDGISQSAIRFLARLDEALEFKDAAVHESAQVALEALLNAQFTNGAFPQIWTGPVGSVPVIKSSYSDDDWRTEGKVKDYWNMYTLNDGLPGTVTQTLLAAADVYKDVKYKNALARLGDFLLLAQMPEPQPAWAQQYSRQMQPIWARRFEPASITAGESQDVLETLLKIYETTGDKKYLDPVPRALAYLKKSLLPDGRLARYYELKTNRPLYMTRRDGEYFLTYDDSMLPDHYGWKVDSRGAAQRSPASYRGAGRRRALDQHFPRRTAGWPTEVQAGRSLHKQRRVQPEFGDAERFSRGVTIGRAYLSSFSSKSIVFSLFPTSAFRSVVFGCVYFEGIIGGGRAALCSGKMPS